VEFSRSGRSASTRPVTWAVLAIAAGGATGGWAYLSERARELDAANRRVAELRARTVDQEMSVRTLRERLDAIEAQSTATRRLERAERERMAGEIARLRELDLSRTTAHLAAVEARVQLLREAADRSESGAARRKLEPGLVHRELVQPTVRVNAKSEVGSGSLIYSRKHDGKLRTFVLTAWHIVKDNVSGEGGPTPIDVDVYDEKKKAREIRARLVQKHEALDLALLELDTDRPITVTARLATRKDMERATVFSKVYAIGCPLGYAPMPTSGELTSLDKELDGINYWMTNAPTIFGNSGGGIYFAETRQLVGVLSRISAYKNLIDVAVPHMGIVTPMTVVYDWLETTEFAFVHREALEAQAADSSILNASHPSGR
jgi:S1-C subfamily serine protease